MQNNSFKKKKTTPNGNKPFSGSRNKKRPQRQGRGQKKSNLNPVLLVKKATEVALKNYESDRRIEDLPISPNLIECLISKGFRKPTEIQDRTIEALLEKRDLLGIAQTGTGKTGAFLVPIIEQLLDHKQKNFALVMVPTRELATQVEEEFQSMAKGLGIYSACFIGGTNINKDINSLKRAKHVIIGTPGRLLDLHNRKSLNFGNFNTLVLDEFDRMLDMGFVHDVKRIIGTMHKRKHTLLFSATLDKTQEELIVDILHNPITVKVSSGDTTGDHIDQDIIRLKQGEDKFKVLQDMLLNNEFQKVLLFEETKHKANRLCGKLNKVGISADQIHGNKSQNARQRALNSFKQGKIRVLVATDVAARGIDVSDVTHVINYQVPMTFDSYIHRIGRTGRAGKTGKAFTFVEA
ncbi:ATP-dependent RNA helicase RhlE [hydrothermal vent metagenome]|uniref:ATP-dependent RNA helicase RhlE n=1 Tax=hydrothermal vent metagenome TaxID=652676 RepID=A0A3B0VB90_9ZZZZ